MTSTCRRGRAPGDRRRNQSDQRKEGGPAPGWGWGQERTAGLPWQVSSRVGAMERSVPASLQSPSAAVVPAGLQFVLMGKKEAVTSPQQGCVSPLRPLPGPAIARRKGRAGPIQGPGRSDGQGSLEHHRFICYIFANLFPETTMTMETIRCSTNGWFLAMCGVPQTVLFSSGPA